MATLVITAKADEVGFAGQEVLDLFAALGEVEEGMPAVIESVPGLELVGRQARALQVDRHLDVDVSTGMGFGEIVATITGLSDAVVTDGDLRSQLAATAAALVGEALTDPAGQYGWTPSVRLRISQLDRCA